MNDELKALEESAKATQEVAKTTGLIVETGRDFASFIKAPFETALSIWDDNLKFRKWTNQVNIIQEAKLIMQKNGLEPSNNIPLKFAIPLLEAASLEDDDYLKDLWVNLLVNSSIENNEFTLEKSYINVLEQLTPLEAKILKTIYSNIVYEPYNRMYSICTQNLPESINYTINDTSNGGHEEIKYIKDNNQEVNKFDQDCYNIEPSVEIKLALTNLDRLSCIEASSVIVEKKYSIVYGTLFGANLYMAIKDI
jgi:hypothetical protein